MPYSIPTLSEIKLKAQSYLENRTGQAVSVNERSFTRVLANTLAILVYPFYLFLSWNKKQCFIISADEDSLENFHGASEGIIRGKPTRLEARITLTVTDDSVINKTVSLENKATGLFYFPKYDYSVTAEENTIEIVAEGTGTEYLLSVGNELSISSRISGISELCTVSEITISPSDKEEVEDYRKRLLSAHNRVSISSASEGIATAYDYKVLAESVSGVYRAFCFSGRPNDAEASLPGDVSVFIEADPGGGTDGVASSDLIESVKTKISQKQSLGCVNSTLFVSGITRLFFSISISDFDVGTASLSALKKSVTNAIDEYFRSRASYMPSVDAEWDRRDIISQIGVGKIMFELLLQYGSSASSVTIMESGEIVSNKNLIGGEVARLGTITGW